jgi:prolipoprotein diacylglyceryl transferase
MKRVFVFSVAAIPPPPFSGFELGPFAPRLYGIVIAVGALLALQMLSRRYTARGGDARRAEQAGLLALAGGFLGARIGYVIPRFFSSDTLTVVPFSERPADIFAIWQGGLAFFGGLIGGALAVIIYLWRTGTPFGPFADAIAPALPLAQAIGRTGNYFNQELFGRPTEVWWALQVDPGPAQRAGYPNDTTFHPTFLYESLWNFLLVGLILWLDKRGWLQSRGALFIVYLAGYGLGRGWIEALRIDTIERYFGLSRNNWIALAIFVGALITLWWRERAVRHADTV